MIKIVFAYKNSHLVSLEVRGHAGSGPYGHDLVCAGISAITLGGLNALENSDDYAIKTSSGHVSVSIDKIVSEHDATVFSTIEKQLESLAMSYPDNVRLERKKSS